MQYAKKISKLHCNKHNRYVSYIATHKTDKSKFTFRYTEQKSKFALQYTKQINKFALQYTKQKKISLHCGTHNGYVWFNLIAPTL